MRPSGNSKWSLDWILNNPSPWQRLLVALLIVAAASALRMAFFGSLGDQIPYLLYFPAVTLAALYGGLLAGLLATVLSAGLVLFWINQGRLSSPEWLALAVFVISGALIASICEVMRRGVARERLGREARYRRLFETCQDGILILDAATGRIVDVNPYLIGLLGYSHEAFLGKKVWELGLFKDLVANEANFLELQAKEYLRNEDMPLETSDGRRIEVEFVSNVYLVNEQKVIQCQIRDITERKQAEGEIQEQLDELRRWQAVMLDTADRSMKLKREVNELSRRLGEPIRYPSQEPGAEGSDQVTSEP